MIYLGLMCTVRVDEERVNKDGVDMLAGRRKSNIKLTSPKLNSSYHTPSANKGQF